MYRNCAYSNTSLRVCLWICGVQDINAASELHEDLDAQRDSLKDQLDFITKTQEEVMQCVYTPCS